MKLNKYSQSKGGVTVGSFADRNSSSSSSSSSSLPSSSVNRELWGRKDTGDDIDGDIVISGNAYVGPVMYDEEENMVPPDHSFPSDEGNLYASGSVTSPLVHGASIFLDINGVRTNLLDVLMPVGSVIMFDGKAPVPPNWAVCDGRNGTPNLLNRFVKGVTSAANVGRTGGRSSINLGDYVPAHTHKFYNYLIQVHGNNEVFDRESDGDFIVNGVKMSVGKHSANRSPTPRAQTDWDGSSDIPFILHETEPAGSGSDSDSSSSVSTEPPYYTLIYIMRVR